MAADTNTTFCWKAIAPSLVDRRGGPCPTYRQATHPAWSLGPRGAGPQPAPPNARRLSFAQIRLAVVLVVAQSDVLQVIDFPRGSQRMEFWRGTGRFGRWNHRARRITGRDFPGNSGVRAPSAVPHVARLREPDRREVAAKAAG